MNIPRFMGRADLRDDETFTQASAHLLHQALSTGRGEL